MLAKFVQSHRAEIVAHARSRFVERTGPQASQLELEHGIPVFLDQLVEALRLASSKDTLDREALRRSARVHGQELLRMGFSAGQVVRDYGEICQSITELARSGPQAMSSDEFQVLNLCLDEAIAEAVGEFVRQREAALEDQGTERMGVLAHELGNLLNTALLALDSVQSGHVSPSGSTGLLLKRSLLGMRDLVQRSLAAVRLEAGIRQTETFPAVEMLEEVETGAAMKANAREIELTVTGIDRAILVDGDKQVLVAAVANLLSNALKFTPRHGRVRLQAALQGERVRFSVEDECGGLPLGDPQGLFRPYQQGSANHEGVGLGLAISRRAAHAHGGEILVSDLPGKGCIFTLELPCRVGLRAEPVRAQGGDEPERLPMAQAL